MWEGVVGQVDTSRRHRHVGLMHFHFNISPLLTLLQSQAWDIYFSLMKFELGLVEAIMASIVSRDRSW